MISLFLILLCSAIIWLAFWPYKETFWSYTVAICATAIAIRLVAFMATLMISACGVGTSTAVHVSPISPMSENMYVIKENRSNGKVLVNGETKKGNLYLTEEKIDPILVTRTDTITNSVMRDFIWPANDLLSVDENIILVNKDQVYD